MVRFSIATKTRARWAAKEVNPIVQYYLLGQTRPVLSVPSGKEIVPDMRRLPLRELSIEIEEGKILVTEA